MEHSFIIIFFLYKKNRFSEKKDTSNNYLERYYVIWSLLTLLCRTTKFPVLFLCVVGKEFIYRKSSNCYWGAVNLPLNIEYKHVVIVFLRNAIVYVLKCRELICIFVY